MMSKALHSQISDLLKGQIVILGVGNVLRNDDGVGPLIARNLAGKVNAIVIDGGEAPENYTGVIRKETPDIVLLIDAVDFKGEAGDIRLIEKEEIPNLRLTTHNMSLKLFVDFVENEVQSKVLILGIQPKNAAFGDSISKELLSSASKVEDMLINLLGEKSKCII